MPTSQQNAQGMWVPAIPMPLFVGWRLRKSECQCGDRFPTQRRYREHYALKHVMGLD